VFVSRLFIIVLIVVAMQSSQLITASTCSDCITCLLHSGKQFWSEFCLCIIEMYALCSVNLWFPGRRWQEAAGVRIFLLVLGLAVIFITCIQFTDVNW